MQLVLDQLTLSYDRGDQQVRPIDGLDVTVDDGEFVLLLGPSGCGKSTLLSAIAGLLTPASGSIIVDGVDVTKLSARELVEHRRSRVGVVFQSFNLIASLTAVENVAAPLTMAGVRRHHADRRARELLTEFGLEHRLDHRPGTMSGGQQQRVAIARALAADPPVILADEPTAHLDHEQVAVVRDTLRRLATPGRIVVVATHDDRLIGHADRVVRLDHHAGALAAVHAHGTLVPA
jgi:putative ABC transport system ATP-binding protein